MRPNPANDGGGADQEETKYGDRRPAYSGPTTPLQFKEFGLPEASHGETSSEGTDQDTEGEASL